MQPTKPLRLNEQIYQEACEWFIEFRSGDLDAMGRRRFDLWARKSPEHLAAYLEIAALWNEKSAQDSNLTWDTQTLIAQAAAEDPSVVPLLDRSRTDAAATVLPDAPSPTGLRALEDQQMRSRKVVSRP